MKKIELLGPGNGGDQGKIAAVLQVYPFLGEICGTEEISVLRILSPEDLPTHGYSVCGHGYNYSGTTYLVSEGKISRKISYSEMRDRRKVSALPEPYLNSPQTELSGNEDACVLVEKHSEGDRASWISVDAFICPPRATLKGFPSVMAWLAEPQVRKDLKEAGFI